jgi:cytochrome c553
MRPKALIVVLSCAIAAGLMSQAESQTQSSTSRAENRPSETRAAVQAPPSGSRAPAGRPQSASALANRAPWTVHSNNIGADPLQGRFIATGGQYGEIPYSCDACHGIDGTGNRSGAFPRIASQSEWYLYSNLYDFATGLRPSDVMGPVARSLTQRDMQDVAAYYASLGPQPYPPSLPSHNGSLGSEGRDIATKGFPEKGVLPCVTCHGAQGRGRAPLFPYIGGQYESYLEYQLHQFKSGERGGEFGSVMTAIANGLSDEQIEAVSTYFASLMPAAVPAPDQVPGHTAAQPPQEPEQTHLGAAMHPKAVANEVVLPDAYRSASSSSSTYEKGGKNQ